MSKILLVTIEHAIEVSDDFRLIEWHVPALIKSRTEEAKATELTAYFHSLGSYTDAEVVNVTLIESHDTRQ